MPPISCSDTGLKFIFVLLQLCNTNMYSQLTKSDSPASQEPGVEVVCVEVRMNVPGAPFQLCFSQTGHKGLNQEGVTRNSGLLL